MTVSILMGFDFMFASSLFICFIRNSINSSIERRRVPLSWKTVKTTVGFPKMKRNR